MSLPVALTPGTVIGGHYIVGTLINSGGFGAVYRGTDTSEGNRPCAIKETYDVTPSARRQALIEASVLFTIRSRHLPEVYDAFEDKGRFYLVMQLIEGQNLLQLLHARVPGSLIGEQEPYQQAKGPCGEQEVLTWLLPIIDVLQELHSRNPPVIHRDIKPGNIILMPNQTAVLVDFGLTKFYDPNSSTQTMIKAVSEGFSPLEQYLGKTTPQSDIYAIAATMYLLLTNRLPPAAINRSMRDELIAPHLLNPALSPKIEQVLLRALALNADQRYRNMSEFAQALRGSGFAAHADPTIAVPPVPVPSTRASVPPPPPIRAYQSVPGVARPSPSGASPARVATPAGGVPSPAKAKNANAPGLQAAAPPYPYVPPGYVVVPQSALVPQKPLPTPFNQGCLWGLFQGVLGALLVLLVKTEPAFYQSIFMGLVFYVIAGVMTTRRGGGSLRGMWAGYWAGIFSTIIFWLVLGVGIAISFFQKVEALRSAHPGLSFDELSKRASKLVMPAFPASSPSSGQSSAGSLLVALGIGLLTACILGWIGGLLGGMRHRSAQASKQQQAMHP